ncbi:hypothetical protein EC957_005680 [Mortierella hygrophila]|uniref:Myb-like domain-containing protein n=1 Tax=Mortierella hygrophila TaxID=979708 RepID=A0A9P6FEK3_9FUNG|nr:hypothetical protein EC957_005680 [Mortierella hygrophila]
MSIVSSIPSDTMGSSSDRVTSAAAASALAATSPPVTPPTKSSGPNAGSASQTSLPSPPPSSSSRHSRAVDQDEYEYDEDQNINNGHSLNGSSIEKIARRLPSSSTIPSAKAETEKKSTSSGNITKTHSSSSSTSSLASSNQHLPATLNNKHISVAKTKTLGHLARSTSSEVDSEVANALASGRSIVSKTDWKEEDAQYLVQLIEAQFPKGNIIWDWVGHQMVDRGFTKSQCRSKWKRIRTKVLHGDGNPHTKDRDHAAHEQEVDELNEEEYEELPTDIPDLKWRHQQAEQEISTSQSQSARANGAYDRPQYAYRTGSTVREEELAAAARRSQHSNRAVTQSSYPEHAGEPWSEDDERRQDVDSYLLPAKRFSEYPEQDRTPPSRSPQQHRRTSSSNHQSSAQGEDAGRSSTTLSAIAATPTIFGKIEWKPEDSDYLVHLIETKFASRKVDWAYVSKQMEGRGYDRTQCKSRWWRVQHRQSQSQQSQGGVGGSVSSPSSRGGRPRKNIDRRESQQQEFDQLEDDKEKTSDNEEIHPEQALEAPREYRRPHQQHDPAAMRSPSIPPPPPPQHLAHPSDLNDSRAHYQQEPSHGERQEDEESQGTADDHARSPRATRGHEHQKHIEWKEEDSQHMFRMIEREFPVGNVVWSVIGERMASRGYSQTQCMSKWRRHLKNSKTSNDSTGGRPSGISMDLDDDMDIDGSSSYNMHRENRLTGFRRPRKEDLLVYGDNRGSVVGGGDHHSSSHPNSGKRVKSDLVDSRAYDRDEYRSPVGQLDARLVEMEFERYFNVGNKRRRTIEGEGHGNEPYAVPESAADSYYDRRASSSYEDESAHHHHQHHHHHHRRLSSEVRHEDYPRRSSYRQDERASSGGYGERERSRRRSPPLTDEGVVVIDEEAGPVVSSTGSAGHYEPERDGHNGERQGRYDEREWDSAMVVDNDQEPPSMSSKSQHREPHSSKSHYAGENNSRSYYEERESTRTTLDQNKEAQHRPQEPARYTEPIGRSLNRDLVGTTHISSSSSSSYPNGASRGGHRDRELVSRRGAEEDDYHVVELDERHYRDHQQPPRRRSNHQPQQHHSRRLSSPGRGGRDDGGRNGGGYYDDGYGKRRHRQSSAEYEHHRQDYGYHQSSSYGRSGQYQERDGELIDYAMEDDLDWANGRWEGRDMARLAAAVARQGRRWDAIREQIRIPVLVSPYDDQEYEDIYDGFRFEPHASTSSVNRQYSRHHHHHSSSSAAQPQQRYSQPQPHQLRHQRRTSYQQSPREDGRKPSSHRIHHRPSSSTTAPAPGPVDDNYSPSPLTSSTTFKRPSGAIASVSYSKNDAISSAKSSSPYTSGAAEVVVLDGGNIEREVVEGRRNVVEGERGRPHHGGEQEVTVDVDSIEQDQGRRGGEGGEGEEVEMTMAETHGQTVVGDEDVLLEGGEESRIVEVESMEIDEEHQEMTAPSATKASSEGDTEIMQSVSTSSITTMVSTTTTTTASRTTTAQDVEALAMH